MRKPRVQQVRSRRNRRALCRTSLTGPGRTARCLDLDTSRYTTNSKEPGDGDLLGTLRRGS